jgi:hypothetical protein
MTCNNPEISDKLILYLDGSLSHDARQQIEEHISSCPSCRGELKDLSGTVASLKTAAEKLKRHGAHVDVEDLILFQAGPDSMDSAKAEEIESHLKICKGCAYEMELLGEAPTPNGESQEDAHVPAAILEKFNELYVRESPVEEHAKAPAERQPGFLRQLMGLISPPLRLAYVSLAGILILLFISGVFQKEISRITGTVPVNAPALKGFEELAASPIPEGYRSAFSRYLQDKGIQAVYQDGKILVRKDQKDGASLILTRFAERMETLGNRDTRYVPGHIPEDEDRDEFFYHLPGKAGYLVMDARGEIPRGAPSSVYGRQPIISAFSVVEDRESDLILSNLSRGGEMGVIGTDLADREKETVRLQDDFQAKIKRVIEESPSARGSSVKVYVTLSFGRETGGSYKAQSVTIIIENPQPLDAGEKDRLKKEIRHALEGKGDWDETFLFVEK